MSIHNIPEIKGVTMTEDGDIKIGAATVFSHVTNDSLIQKYIPMLGEAVDTVGGPQIRNVATIGGNICNGATSADSASTMWTLEAELVLEGPDGELSLIQKAFIEEAAVQCGFCTPGLIMSAVEIVGTGKKYSRDELRKLISGHLCRCTGYEKILDAMERIVDEVYRTVNNKEN